MEDNNKIETPLLRYFVLYYGNLGIHLEQIKWDNLLRVVNVFRNLLIDLGIVWSLTSMDIFKQFTSVMEQRKPLFGIFVNFALRYLLPGVVVAFSGHYLLFGRKIVQLLDSECFQQIYCNRSMAKKIFFGVFLYDIVRYVVFSYFVVFKIFVQENGLLYNLFCSTCIHLLTVNQYLPCMIVQYIEYGIYKYLCQIECKLTRPNTDLTIIKEIQKLCNLNMKLFQVISLPLIVFLVISIINIIISAYILMFYMQNYVLLIFPAMTICYLLYLTNLNQRIQQKVAQIVIHLHDRQPFVARKQQYQQNRLTFRNMQPRPYYYNCLNHQTEHIRNILQIHFHEVEMYQANFQMRIYNFVQLDRKFLFATILVIGNYIIFIYQTK